MQWSQGSEGPGWGMCHLSRDGSTPVMAALGEERLELGPSSLPSPCGLSGRALSGLMMEQSLHPGSDEKGKCLLGPQGP